MKVVVEVVHWVGMGNEGNFRERDWQNTFYGGNYERLRGVKRGWDPEDLFSARTTVGSEV